MSAYSALAAPYDALTGDVPYEEFADWYETALTRRGGAVHTLLDLGCGTGTLSLLMAERGYEMICTDASADMLSVFQQKLWERTGDATPPLLLCQRSEELDLYGTVDGAYCSLDGMNYLPGALLPEVLRRLRLFIAPGGIFAFDVLTPARMQSLDGGCFVDEREGLLCLWRSSFDSGVLHYDLDLFSEGEDGLWEREQEEHREYAHETEDLRAMLEAAGFGNVQMFTDGPQHEEGRVFITAERM
ncbi:MAG: class I SAM-dependent methyltransferase [Oscillospiraceae bacterium]|nr:class I SAM-dependent methyltransferase [bacterium]MDY5101369.1 class I SAM-dependent methyltransferase [Oscillospiraceae bacterium]